MFAYKCCYALVTSYDKYYVIMKGEQIGMVKVFIKIIRLCKIMKGEQIGMVKI